MRKLIMCLLIGIFLISMASATLPPVKQNDCVNIRTILNTTATNISMMTYPNETTVYLETAMTRQGLKTFNYTWCGTDLIGTYDYSYYDNEGNVYENDFDVTKSGLGEIGEGQGLSLIGALSIIILAGLFFFGISFKIKNPVGKTILIITSGLMLFIAVLFSTVMMTENLGGYDSFINSYSAFLRVMKIILSVGITSLILFAGYLAIRLWRWKRGFLD